MAMSMLHKQSRTVTTRWCFSIGVG